MRQRRMTASECYFSKQTLPSCLSLNSGHVRSIRRHSRAAPSGEFCEVSSEFGRIHSASLRQLLDPDVVGKIFRADADHIIAGDLIAFARDVDASRFAAPRRRVDHGAERHGVEFAVLHGDHRARAAGHQVSDRRVTEVARMFGVVWDWRRAAQFVADGLVDDGHFDAALFKTGLDFAFYLAAQVYLGHADVALRVAVDVFQFGHLFGAEPFRERLGEQRDAVAFAQGAALDYRTFDDVTDVGQPDHRLRELLRNDRAGRARRRADAQRQMARRTPHSHADEPAPRRLRVLHQAVDYADADLTRGLVSERGQRRGQRQVVVDALRNLHDFDRAL